MAKAKPTNEGEQAGEQAFSERDRLALAVYTNLSSGTLPTSKTLEHIAATSFDVADAFFAELSIRRSASTSTAIEFASAAAPSPKEQ